MDKDSVECVNGGKPLKSFGAAVAETSFAGAKGITKYGSTILFLYFFLREKLFLINK